MLGDRVAHVLAARDLDDLLAGPDERGAHLVAHPLRRRRRRGSWSSAATTSAGDRPAAIRVEEDLADLVQRGEVVDVVREVRARTRRPRCRCASRTVSRCAALELGDLAEVGEVVVARREPVAAAVGVRAVASSSRSDVGRARAARRALSSPNDGCTRFTMSASTVWSWSPSRSAKNRPPPSRRAAAR